MIGSLSVGELWFEKGSTRWFSTDGAKLMKLKLDLISMLLVSIDGRSSVPSVEIRKEKVVFTGEMPVENALMLKSTYQFSKKFLTSVSLIFHVSLPEFRFPFYSLH